MTCIHGLPVLIVTTLHLSHHSTWQTEWDKRWRSTSFLACSWGPATVKHQCRHRLRSYNLAAEENVHTVIN